jgi:hypothetical protein
MNIAGYAMTKVNEEKLLYRAPSKYLVDGGYEVC